MSVSPTEPGATELPSEESIPLVVILVSREQKSLIYSAVSKIRALIPTKYVTVAFEHCCLDYLSRGWGVGVEPSSPAGEVLKPFRYRPHADQAEVIAAALSKAKAAIGRDDDAAAHTHICRTFLESEKRWR